MQVQLFFSEEFPGFVHVQKRDGGGFVDSAGVDGGSSGFGASKQDVDDKHARFQESARREHLAERATNHVGAAHVLLDFWSLEFRSVRIDSFMEACRMRKSRV